MKSIPYQVLPLLAALVLPRCSCSGEMEASGDSDTDEGIDTDMAADDGDGEDTARDDRDADPVETIEEDVAPPEAFCGDGTCGADETRSSCPQDCPSCDYSRPPTQLPLMLFYGYFSDSDYMPTSVNDILIDPPLPNIETVFHVSAINFVAGDASGAGNGDACTPPHGRFADFRDAGVRLAKHVVAKRDLMCLLTGHPYTADNPCDGRLGWNVCYGPAATGSPGAECAAEVLIAKIRNGYDYLSIDEIYEGVLSESQTFPDGVTSQDLSWNNGHMASQRFVELLRLLSAGGYDNRVLLWVGYHTVEIGADGSSNGRLWDLTDIWDACHDDANQTHCRKILFEVYGNEPACLVTRNVIGASTYLNLDDIAERLDRLGIGSISTVGIGTTPDSLNGYPDHDHHACDLAPDHGLNCSYTGSGRGSLRLQFGRMHQHTEWCGVGFYSLERAESTGDYTLTQLAQSLRGYIAWWDTNFECPP
jgi:hypothetical protein